MGYHPLCLECEADTTQGRNAEGAKGSSTPAYTGKVREDRADASQSTTRLKNAGTEYIVLLCLSLLCFFPLEGNDGERLPALQANPLGARRNQPAKRTHPLGANFLGSRSK